MRLTTKLRYWLLRKLSCGDMVVLNLHISAAGQWSKRNTGPSIVYNLAIEGKNDIGLLMTPRGISKRGIKSTALSLRTEGSEISVVSNSSIGVFKAV